MDAQIRRPPLLTAVVKQRRKVERLRDEHREATQKLARLLIDVRNSDDPAVTLAAAAREMGVSKQTVNSLVASNR